MLPEHLRKQVCEHCKWGWIEENYSKCTHPLPAHIGGECLMSTNRVQPWRNLRRCATWEEKEEEWKKKRAGVTTTPAPGTGPLG